MKEKVVCGNLYQPADSVRLATPLARFGKVVRTASKQRVGSSSLPGCAIPLNLNELEKVAFTLDPLRRKQMVGLPENGKTCYFLAFLGVFVEFYRAFVRRKLNCHENVTATHEGCPVVRIANNLSRIEYALLRSDDQVLFQNYLR